MKARSAEILVSKHNFVDFNVRHPQNVYQNFSYVEALVTMVTKNIGQNFFLSAVSSQFMEKQMSRAMRKCVLCHMRTTKVQISLRIRTVSRFYSRNFKTLASFCGCVGWFVSGLVGTSQRHVFSWQGSNSFCSCLWLSRDSQWFLLSWIIIPVSVTFTNCLIERTNTIQMSFISTHHSIQMSFF